MKLKYLILLFMLLSYEGYTQNKPVELLFNSPKKFNSPSSESSSVAGKVLINLINEATQTIHFAIYGMRSQPKILNALIRAKKRGINIYGIVDKDVFDNNYYSNTEELIDAIKGIKDDYQSDVKYKKNKRSYTNNPYWKRPLGFNGPPSTVGYSIDNQTAVISVQASKKEISFAGNIMHNKFFVFDEEKIWTGSTNISDSGTGGYNANISTLITSKEIAGFYITEFDQMYFQGKFHNLKNLNSKLERYNNTHKIQIFFSPQTKVLSNKIIPLINAAKKTINVSVFFLTHKNVCGALIDAHRRGVKVRVIIDASGANNEYTKFQFLRVAGIPVKIENWGGKLHSKAASIDDDLIILGSMNWTSAGENINDENTLIIRDLNLASEYNSFFNDIWNSVPENWLENRPSAESQFSTGSCYDGMDNNYDGQADNFDFNCINQTNEVNKLPPIFIVKKSEGSGLIKGNISKNGNKIYHLPNQKYYNRVKIDLDNGEYFFANESEARKLGFRKSKI